MGRWIGKGASLTRLMKMGYLTEWVFIIPEIFTALIKKTGVKMVGFGSLEGGGRKTTLLA